MFPTDCRSCGAHIGHWALVVHHLVEQKYKELEAERAEMIAKSCHSLEDAVLAPLDPVNVSFRPYLDMVGIPPERMCCCTQVMSSYGMNVRNFA